MNQSKNRPSYQTPRKVHPSTPQPSTRTSGTSPHRTCPTSSGKPPKRSLSLNLFSIINKFEALDAVSLPYRYPGLQPAPLQVSRNSSQRRDGHGAGMERLSTIFSPGSKGYEGYIPLGSEENLRPTPRRHEPAAGAEECTPTTGIKRWKGRPRKSMSPQKSRTSTTDRGDRRSRSDSDLKDTARLLSSAKTRLENEGSKRHRSIKEMIKFYDGAASTRYNTKTKTSFADSSISETPVSFLLSPMVTNDDRSSTVRRRTLTKQSTIYVTSTGSPHTTAGRRQSHTFGLRARESFSTHFPTSKWSTTRPRSPSRTRRQSSFRETPDTNSKRSSFRGRSLPRIVVKQQSSEARANGTSRTPTRHQQNQSLGPSRSGNGSRMSLSKAKIGNKIEALYRAKSLEREKKESPERPPKTPTNRNITKSSPWQSSARTVIVHREGPDISPSKVAEMKKLFEGKQGVEQPSPVSLRVDSKLTKLQKESSPESQKPFPLQVQLQPPPLMRDISNTRTPVIPATATPEKLPQSLSPQTTALASLKPNNVAEPISPQRPQNKTLVDRIKLFEEGVRPKETTGRLKKRSFSGKGANPIIASRKTFFELPSWKNVSVSKPKIHNKAEPPNANEIEAIVEEVNDGAAGGKAGKRKHIVGKWNAFSLDSNGTGHSKNNKENDETQGLLTRTSEELEKMVVKEVECGLKEPKPMRLVEMKRMMLLCREKAGFGADREKMKVGGQFKKF